MKVEKKSKRWFSYRTTTANCDSKRRPECKLSDELLLSAQGSNVVLIVGVQGRLDLGQMALLKTTIAAAARGRFRYVRHLAS
jgi:hypothetical protein